MPSSRATAPPRARRARSEAAGRGLPGLTLSETPWSRTTSSSAGAGGADGWLGTVASESALCAAGGRSMAGTGGGGSGSGVSGLPGVGVPVESERSESKFISKALEPGVA